MNCLYNINNITGFVDLNFSIEQMLKFNNISFNENKMDIKKDDREIFDNVESVVKTFLAKKNEIIDEISGIDKFIGNISLEEE